MTKFGKCEKCLTIFVFCLQKRQERRRNELLPFVEEIVSKTAQEAQFRNNNDGIFVKTLHAIFEELKWSSTREDLNRTQVVLSFRNQAQLSSSITTTFLISSVVIRT